MTFKAAKKALDSITVMAKEKGLLPVISNPHLFHQLPCSFFFRPHGLTLIIHVPLYNNLQKFQLYQYVPFPVYIGTNRLVTKIAPKRTLLAISEDRAYFREMTTDDLALCNKHYGSYVCHDSRFVKIAKPSVHSCLMRLFYSQTRKILQQCDLEAEPIRDDVIQLEQNNFAVFSSNPSTYSVTCANGTFEDGLQLDNRQRLHVDQGCFVRLNESILYSQSQLFYEEPLKSMKWRLPINEIFDDQDIALLEEALHQADDASHLPPVNINALKTLQSMKNFRKPFHFSNWAAWAGLVIGGVAILAFGLFLYCYCKASCRKNGSGSTYQPVKVEFNTGTIPEAPAMAMSSLSSPGS